MNARSGHVDPVMRKFLTSFAGISTLIFVLALYGVYEEATAPDADGRVSASSGEMPQKAEVYWAAAEVDPHF